MTARDQVTPAALLLLAVVAALVGHTTLGDYNLVPSDDNAAPMIEALARGDFGRAADVIPAMGLTSILLRVPAAILGGSNLEWVYGLGSLLCLLPSVILAWFVDRRLGEQDRPPLYRLLLGALLVAGPAVVFALDAGHPEDVLGGTLCIAAVLAAGRGRVLAAAVLLGLAIGTKQWAIVAAFPVLLAVDAGSPSLVTRQRVRAAIIGAFVALACIGPVIAMNPDRYSEIGQSLAKAGRAYPQSLLWPAATASTSTVSLGAGETEEITTWSAAFGLTRAPWTAVTLLLGLALVPVSRRAARAAARPADLGEPASLDDRTQALERPSASLEHPAIGLGDPLTLLSTLLVARCLLDPMNLDYYAAPALAALAVHEALRRQPKASAPDDAAKNAVEHLTEKEADDTSPPSTSAVPVWSLGAAAGAYVAWRVLADAAPSLQWASWLLLTAPLLAVAIPPRRRTPPPA